MSIGNGMEKTKTWLRSVQVASMLALLAVLGIGWKVLSQPSAPRGNAPGGGGAAARPGGPGGPGGGQRGPTALPVVAARVMRRDLRQRLEVSGSLRTDNDVRVGSRIAGKVAAVHVREGDRVKPGDILVELDPSDMEAQLDRAHAAHRAALARMDQLAKNRNYRIAQLRNDLKEAEAAVAAAQATVSMKQTGSQLTKAEVRARLQTAQAGVQAAEERLKMLRDGSRRQDIEQAKQAVEQANAEVDNTRAFYQRRRQLVERGLAAQEVLDDAAARLRTANAAHRAALQRQSLVQEGPRTEEIRVGEQELRMAQELLREAEAHQSRLRMSEEEIRTAEAQRRQAQAALSTAQAQQGQDQVIDAEILAAKEEVSRSRADIAFYRAQRNDTTVRATVPGVVTRRTVNTGEAVTPSAVLLNVVALNAVYLEGQVPEIEMARVRTGMKAAVTIDSLGNRKYTGVITELIPVAQLADKSFPIRIAVQAGPGDPQLPPNGFARATIDVGTKRDALVVPKSAIRSEAGQKYVFTIVDGKAKRVEIRQGLADGEFAEVEAGLTDGALVIRTASPAVQDGVAVKAQEST